MFASLVSQMKYIYDSFRELFPSMNINISVNTFACKKIIFEVGHKIQTFQDVQEVKGNVHCHHLHNHHHKLSRIGPG